MTLNETITESMNSIEFYTKRVKSLMAEKNLQLLVLSVVSSISVSEDNVTFHIDDRSDRDEQRKFINQVSRIYKVKLSKDNSYWRESLDVKGTTEGGRTIHIYNYVPPTCQIIEVEEDAADWELDNAKKQIEKLSKLVDGGKKVVKQVVCQ